MINRELVLHPKHKAGSYVAELFCREVAKAVKVQRAKTIVVAPNIEQIDESKGGLGELLGNILSQAEAAGLPVVFALSRKKMGQARHPHNMLAPCCTARVPTLLLLCCPQVKSSTQEQADATSHMFLVWLFP